MGLDSKFRLTTRDCELLAMFCTRVRMASLDQIARCWWGASTNDVVACRRRLRQLTCHGLLGATRALILNLGPLRQPLATWKPFEIRPKLGAVAFQLRVRWSAGYQPATLYLPTVATSSRFGGKRHGRIKRPFQVPHDVGVAEMYFAVRNQRSNADQLWIGEDRLAPYRRRQKLPDAILAPSPEIRPLLILEFGGRYDKRRLTSFHEDAAERRLPYEIW